VTGEEIQTLAESYIDDTIEDADAVLWINDFLREPDLIPYFRYTSTQEITVSDSETWYARTSGHLNIVEILDSDDDKYTGEYELNFDRDKIRIPDPDTYTVYSIIKPTKISALSETPVINEAFHEACSRYVAGKFKLEDNDQNPDGLRLMAEGRAMAKAASVELFRSHDRREQQKVKRCTWG